MEERSVHTGKVAGSIPAGTTLARLCGLFLYLLPWVTSGFFSPNAHVGAGRAFTFPSGILAAYCMQSNRYLSCRSPLLSHRPSEPTPSGMLLVPFCLVATPVRAVCDLVRQHAKGAESSPGRVFARVNTCRVSQNRSEPRGWQTTRVGILPQVRR